MRQAEKEGTMRGYIQVAVSCAIAGTLAASACWADADDGKQKQTEKEKKASPTWKSLFNGRDLTGWKVYPEGTGNWKVEDGILIGSGKASHLFSERGDYENFRYRIEAKINDGGNSGQYFRTHFGPGFPKGYEAQINSTHKDPAKTGSLWGFKNVTEMLVKPDEWFTQVVDTEGNHIRIQVNGKTTVNFNDLKFTYLRGHFALQVHGLETVVKFRTIEVMELPPTQWPARSKMIGQ
jgi:hypothetical protein